MNQAVSWMVEESEEELLLRPIDAATPAGPYLRYDPVYDRISQARRHENQAFPQGVWQRAALQADWELVERLCTETIAQRSKDMQLAAWRTEALLHLHGLAGYSQGCHLMLELHQAFATTMHPAPQQASDEDTDRLPLPGGDPGVEHRANIVQWMNEKLSLQMKLLPITAPSELSGAAAFSLADLEAARFRDQALQQQGPHMPGENNARLFDASLALTPTDWLLELWAELQQALELTATLDETFDLCYGAANGGLLQVKGVLEQIVAALAPALQDIEMNEAIAEPVVPEEIAPATRERGEHNVRTVNIAASSDTPFPSIDSFIRTREEAYLRLAEISNFLARIEPHSPVPYLLRRAIAWGGMSLQELLPELLQDPAALRDVGQMLRLHGGSGSSHLK